MIILTPAINRTNERCVYKLSFEDGSFYIGSTEKLSRRIGGYKSAFKNSIGSVNKKLAVMAERFEEMQIEILCVVPNDISPREYEQVLLKQFWGNPFLLNRSPSAYHNGGMIKSK